MKKLHFVVLLLAVSLLVTGCAMAQNILSGGGSAGSAQNYESDGVPKTIRITDMPEEYNGRFATIELRTGSGASSSVAIRMVEPIHNGQVTTELLTRNMNSQFTGTGVFHIVLLITDSQADTTFYQGWRMSQSFTSQITTVPWTGISPL